MPNTSEGAKRAAKELLAQDPDHFSKMSRMSKKPKGGKHSSGSFKKGESTPIQSMGGKASKRGKGKQVRDFDPSNINELEI